MSDKDSFDKGTEEKIIGNDKVNPTNRTKILVGIIFVLFIIIGVLLVIILKGDGDNDDNISDSSSGTTAASVPATDSDTPVTEQTSENNTVTDDTQNNTDDSDAVVTLSNQWESGGTYYGQIDVRIKNSTSEELKDWNVEIAVSTEVQVDSAWNCRHKLDNGRLVITCADYNAVISAGSELKDIGLIIKSSKKSDIEALTKGVSFTAGDKGSSSAEQAGDTTTEQKTEATTEQRTEATTEQKAEATTEQRTEGTTEQQTGDSESGAPYANHGRLSVKGVDLVDASGNTYQLKGVSTHGIAWFPDYVNKEAFKTLRDDWNANLIRLAMYSGENSGYCTGGDKDYLKNLMISGVDAATELGMYVIIDWHVLGDQNPLTYKEEAKVFFDEMSEKYKKNGNVIYEICNEPNGGTTWADVKSYAEEVIPVIKANSPDAVIIVGTPTWSQDVDQAAADPISGFSNIMYAAHFYAATHTDWLRNKVTAARESGIPIFISEFSICDASGNGAIDYNQAEEWFKLIEDCNLSYAAWSLCNKAETSALISSSCTKTSGWSEEELSDCGKWLKKKILGR